MRIKMTKTAAGPQGVFAAGKEYEIDDALAERLLIGSAAVPVDQPKPADFEAKTEAKDIMAETATAEPDGETADLPASRPRKYGRKGR